MNDLLIKAITFVASMVCLALIGVGVYVLIDYWTIYTRERIRLRMEGEKGRILKRTITISGSDLIDKKTIGELIRAEIRDAQLDGNKERANVLQEIADWLDYLPGAKLTLEEEKNGNQG